MTNDLYWLAIKGPAAPACNIPMPAERAKRMGVIVGERAGQKTLWQMPGKNIDIDLSGESNYESLIGYRTMYARDKSQSRLINGSVAAMRAEIARIGREEVVIFHD